MHWTKSCSNYRWQTRRLYQIRAFIYLGISEFWLLPFPTTFLPTEWLSWSKTTFMAGCQNALKQWWPTLRPAHKRKTYSNYLWAAREAEKEDSMELSQSPWNQTTDNTTKPRTTSFFTLQKLKENQRAPKVATIQLAHLEEESAGRDKDVESKDPDGIDQLTEEFMVHIARAVKDAQVEEKCCYHCSSLEHFICDCLLVRTSRENMQLNCKEGMASKKGAQAPQTKMMAPKNPQEEVSKV